MFADLGNRSIEWVPIVTAANTVRYATSNAVVITIYQMEYDETIWSCRWNRVIKAMHKTLQGLVGVMDSWIGESSTGGDLA